MKLIRIFLAITILVPFWIFLSISTPIVLILLSYEFKGSSLLNKEGFSLLIQGSVVVPYEHFKSYILTGKFFVA